MKKRQKERKIKKAFTQIEKVNKQIIRLNDAYNALVETFGNKHTTVVIQAIRLEYMKNKLNEEKKCQQAIIRELNK